MSAASVARAPRVLDESAEAPVTLPVEHPSGVRRREDLSGLEAALVGQIGDTLTLISQELGHLRAEMRHQARLLLSVFVGLWLLMAFALAVLAARSGVDPRLAAEAVQQMQQMAPPPSKP